MLLPLITRTTWNRVSPMTGMERRRMRITRTTQQRKAESIDLAAFELGSRAVVDV